jgi:molybdenum cofactor cytidylyltransferase
MAEGYTAVVLAAGASSRMGSPKSLLAFDGLLCVDLVVRTCLAGGCSRVMLVLGADSATIREKVELKSELVLVTNENYRDGQTSSVKAGLTGIVGEYRAFFIFPVDYPMVEPSDMKSMIQAHESRGSKAGGVIPVHGGRRGHPVLLARRHAEEIVHMDNTQPLHDYIRPLAPDFFHLELDNPGLVQSMNTPEEYAALLSLYRNRPRGETRGK